MNPTEAQIDSLCGPKFPFQGWYKVSDTVTIGGCRIQFVADVEYRNKDLLPRSSNVVILEAYPEDSGPDWKGGEWSDMVAAYLLKNTHMGHDALWMARIDNYLG